MHTTLESWKLQLLVKVKSRESKVEVVGVCSRHLVSPVPLYLCRIRLVSFAKVVMSPRDSSDEESVRSGGLALDNHLSMSQSRKNLLDILLAKPLISVAFEDMQMVVKKPEAMQEGRIKRSARTTSELARP